MASARRALTAHRYFSPVTSQVGLAALPLLTLARKTIVIGDDKQTSPELP